MCHYRAQGIHSRKLRHCDAFIRVRRSCPDLGQGQTIAAGEFHRRKERLRLEPRGEDNGIILLGAVLPHELNALRSKALDPRRLQLNIRPRKRRIIII
jgi:hypothetical protein